MGELGGVIKLRGEDEYKRALKEINQALRETGSKLTEISTKFDNSDKSMSNMESASKRLKTVLDQQKDAYKDLKATYEKMEAKYKESQKALEDLETEYKKQKEVLNQLKSTVGEGSEKYQEQEKIVAELEKKFATATKTQNENKIGMSKLATQMSNSQTAIEKTKNEINKLNAEMDKSQREAKESDTAYGTLKSTISQQESKLQSLKNEYANVVLEQGKNSKSAKDLAQDIDSLSGELQKNKTKMSDAESAADKLDKSLDNVSESAKKTANGGFTVLKGSLSDLISNGIQKLASAIKGQLGSAIARVDTINAYKKTMENLGYATEDVTKSSEALKEGIEGLPTTLPNIMSMQQQYAALGYSIDDATDLTLALNNATLAGGQGQEVANSALQQWYQILSAGKPNLESWRIINSAMPAQLNQIAEAMLGSGKKSRDLFEAWQKGTVTTDQIKDSLIKLNKEGGGNLSSFEKQAQDSTGGIETSMQNVKAAISNALANIIESIGQSNIADFFNNLKPVIKQVGDTMAEMVKKIDWKAFGKLVSDALKLALQGFKWIIDNQKLVINALKAVIAGFVTKKIIDWGKALQNGINDLKDFAKRAIETKAAQESLKNMGNVTKGIAIAQEAWNKAWSANPIGMIAGAVSIAITAFDMFVNSTDDAAKATDEFSDEIKKLGDNIDNQKNSWDSLKESQQKAVDAGMTELSYYQDLWKELQNIVDQNGKVKEGYEARASFITDTLSEALDIEIKNVGGVIQQYDNLKQIIEKVMEKKKAQLILDSQESKYKEALENQFTAARKLKEAEEQLFTAKEKTGEISRKVSEKMTELLRETDPIKRAFHVAELNRLQEEQRQRDEDLKNAKDDYNKQKNLIGEYAQAIDQYEKNMALAHEGRYDEMTNINWNYIKEFQKAGDAEKAQLEANIKQHEDYLNALKEIKDENGNYLYKEQIKRGEQELEELKKQLEKYNSTTEEGLNNVNDTWKEELSAQLKEITGQDAKFEDAGGGNIQMYIDGIKTGDAGSKEAMKKLVEDTIEEAKKKKADAEKAGENLIDGVKEGIKDQNKQNSVFSAISNFAGGLLNTLKKALSIASPSKATKEVGQFFLEGLSLGLKAEESSVLKQISTFGKNFVDKLGNKLSEGKNLAKGFGADFSNSMRDVAIDINRNVPSKIGTKLSVDMQSAKNAPYNLQNSLDNNSERFVINIENFVNNREQDVQAFAKELEFYSRRNAYALG